MERRTCDSVAAALGVRAVRLGQRPPSPSTSGPRAPGPSAM